MCGRVHCLLLACSLRYVCTCHARIPICARAIHLTTSNVLQYYARFPRSAKYAYIEVLPFKIRQLLHRSLQSPTLYTVRLLLTALLSSLTIADLVYLDLLGH